MKSTTPPLIFSLLLGPLAGLHATAPELSQSCLPDTGQTHHYMQSFGEKSDFCGRAPSYADNGDSTMTDKVSGLKAFFTAAQAASYWASTSQSNRPERSWFVDFTTGLVSYADKTDRLNVRVGVAVWRSLDPGRGVQGVGERAHI